MTAAHRAWAAVILGVLALGLLVAADVLAWPLSPLTAGLIGMVAGWPAGYLAPSPRQQHASSQRVPARSSGVPAAAGDSTTRRIDDLDG